MKGSLANKTKHKHTSWNVVPSNPIQFSNLTLKSPALFLLQVRFFGALTLNPKPSLTPLWFAMAWDAWRLSRKGSAWPDSWGNDLLRLWVQWISFRV